MRIVDDICSSAAGAGSASAGGADVGATGAAGAAAAAGSAEAAGFSVSGAGSAAGFSAAGAAASGAASASGCGSAVGAGAVGSAASVPLASAAGYPASARWLSFLRFSPGGFRLGCFFGAGGSARRCCQSAMAPMPRCHRGPMAPLTFCTTSRTCWAPLGGVPSSSSAPGFLISPTCSLTTTAVSRGRTFSHMRPTKSSGPSISCGSTVLSAPMLSFESSFIIRLIVSCSLTFSCFRSDFSASKSSSIMTRLEWLVDKRFAISCRSPSEVPTRAFSNSSRLGTV
mmetsp:Transcript_181/g.347  ORF Transcript_181/g.347 Transcript_181/m.347 type:complete len:284 (+) Transcript_181:325-1176(+)